MFGLYFVTTVISGGIFYLTAKANDAYLKRNHHISTTGDKKIAELNFDILSYAFKALMPGYNIYIAIKILWDGSKQFEENAADALKKGKIRKMTDDEIRAQEELEMQEEFDEQQQTFQDDQEFYGPTSINTFVDKAVEDYNQMTINERLAELDRQREELESEKEFLLNIKNEKQHVPIQFKLEKK